MPERLETLPNKNPTQLKEVLSNIIHVHGFSETTLNEIEEVFFEFADWYCNGLLNSERKTPKEMFSEFIKLKQITG